MKNILILGGSSEIGQTLIDLLLKYECNITTLANKRYNFLSNKYLKEKKLKILKVDFNKLDDKKLNFFCKKYLNQNFSAFINLIGYLSKKSYEKTSLSDLLKSIKINTFVPFIILKYIVKNMIKNNFGRILNCSSVGIKFGGGKYSYSYSLSKHSLEFIPAEYKNWAKKNVLINNLRIGATNTQIHKKIKTLIEIKKRKSLIPCNRFAGKEEVVNYIWFLINKKNSFMTNKTLEITGGE